MYISRLYYGSHYKSGAEYQYYHLFQRALGYEGVLPGVL